jgi:hypothetical protein
MHPYLRWIPRELLVVIGLGVVGAALPVGGAFAQAPQPEPVEDDLGAPEEPVAPAEAEDETPLAPTQSATPLPEPPAAAAVPVAPAVPITIPDGEAPPVPIAPAFPPAVPNIDYGARMRIATKLQGWEDTEKLDDISQQADADIYMGGAIHRYFKWQAGVTISYAGFAGSNAQVVNVQPLDLLARFEPIPEFNIYMGRMIVVADRYTPSGPWGMDEFYYPGLVGLTGTRVPTAPALQKSGTTGRDLGVNIWGAPLGGHMKYYLGVYQLHDPTLNPLLSGRLQFSLLSPEPAFYQRTTYMGTRDLISFGVGGQYQADGSVGPATPASAAMPVPPPPMTDDFSFLALDLNVEKVLGDAGTLQVYGSYFMFDGDFQRWENYWFAAVGYLLPKPIGIGKIRFSVRYQMGGDTVANSEDASILDAQISYNIMPWFARVQLGYRRMEWTAPATAAAGAQLLAGNQIYLGITLADP